MKTSQFFSFFCSVQHRLGVSPQAAALFFFILGELSATDFASNAIAMTNSRICGTIHISNVALRKCREELIAAGIITFSSADNGKSLSLYTLCETENWRLDVVNVPTSEPVTEVATESQTIAPVSEPVSAVTNESSKSEVKNIAEMPEIEQNLPKTYTNTANPPSHPQNTRLKVSVPAPPASKKPYVSHLRNDTPNPIAKHKLIAATAALRRHSSHPIKLIFKPWFKTANK